MTSESKPRETAMSDESPRTFPCEGCGADLGFSIGAQALQCEFCGFTKQIELAEEAEVQEQDLSEMLRSQSARRREESQKEALPQRKEIRCKACSATLNFTDNLTTKFCPYCGIAVQIEDAHQVEGQIPVDAVLPFFVEKTEARLGVKNWLRSLWFAPNDFLRVDIPDLLRSIYFPYWTFDAMTFTRYTGMRGEHYYETVRRNGKSHSVQRTRWYPASGKFQLFIDDLPVLADESLPREVTRKLEPWPFPKAQPFNPNLLAGHLSKTYEVSLEQGFRIAKQRMEDELREEARRRIGGDEQRITSCSSRFDALTYKHVLLPLWLLALRYGDKTYRLIVNGATGEVQGERPWSWVKISLAILAGVSLTTLVVLWREGILFS